MLEDTVLPSRATVIQTQSNRAKQPQSGSVAIPAVIRAGGQGPSSYEIGNMGDEQFSSSRGLSHSGHQPPMGHQAMMGNFSTGQKALIKNVDDGNQRIKIVIDELCENAPDLPPLGSDPVCYLFNFLLSFCAVLYI